MPANTDENKRWLIPKVKDPLLASKRHQTSDQDCNENKKNSAKAEHKFYGFS